MDLTNRRKTSNDILHLSVLLGNGRINIKKKKPKTADDQTFFLKFIVHDAIIRSPLAESAPSVLGHSKAKQSEAVVDACSMLNHK